MKIKLGSDVCNSPLFVEHHLGEDPPTLSIHWLELNEGGSYESEDGQHWRISRSHYRPPENGKKYFERPKPKAV